MILFKGESGRPRCRSKWRDHVLPRLWKQRWILLYQYEQWRDNAEETYSIRGYDFGILFIHNCQRWYIKKYLGNKLPLIYYYLTHLIKGLVHNTIVSLLPSRGRSVSFLFCTGEHFCSRRFQTTVHTEHLQWHHRRRTRPRSCDPESMSLHKYLIFRIYLPNHQLKGIGYRHVRDICLTKQLEPEQIFVCFE